MTDAELRNLEAQIEHIIKAHQRLINENSSLRKRLEQVVRDRAIHLDKNQKIKDLLKHTIIQLKDKLA